MPNHWTDICAGIGNLAELKIVQYILRHTWGYQEYGIHKHITVDEFIRGRKRRDGSRLDRGTGLAEQSVRNGLAAAKAHGWIEELTDESDKARIKKFYRLKMREERTPAEPAANDMPGDDPQTVGSEAQDLDPEVQELDPGGPNVRPRSETDTQKELFERGHDSMAAPFGAEAAAARLAQPGLKIAAAITEISDKLGDQAHLGSNKAQAMHLFLSSGLADERFVQELFEAAAVTRVEANRRKRSGDQPIRNQMAYYFSVVRKQLGLPSVEKAGGA